MTDEVDEFLAHFGVKGMHWGVRKEEDAPSPEKQAAKATKEKEIYEKRQAKAAPFHKKADEARTQLAEVNRLGLSSPLLSRVYGPKAATASDLKFRLRYGRSKEKAINDASEELTKKLSWAEKNATASEAGKLTSGQKKAIAGASVAVGLVAATAALTVIGNKQLKQAAFSDARGLTAEFAGGPVSYEKFMENVGKSTGASWGSAEHITRIGSTHLDDLDLHIPAGTSFTRISTVAETAVKKGNYATFLDDDVMRYRAAFVNEKGARSLYNVKIDAVNDVVSPSLKKRVDTFIDLVDANAPIKHAPLSSIIDASKEGQDLGSLAGSSSVRSAIASRLTSQKDKDFVMNGPAREVGEKYYHLVTGKNFSTDPLSKTFADSILKKGYNAIVDDMDAGVYGDKPMVLLDHSVFKVASATPLTKEMIEEARANITELIGRKL